MRTVYTTKEGFELDRPLLMPDGRTFRDVFATSHRWSFGDPHKFPPREIETGGTYPRHRRKANEVGPFCSVSARGERWCMDVVANDAVIAAVAPRIVTPDDALSFKIIEHKSRSRALVILDHGYILGSHWLAYIDPSTIPYGPKESP